MKGETVIEKWPELRKLTSKQILEGAVRCAGEEREALLKFLLYLSEVERRRAYEDVRKRSLWEFVEETLGFTRAETRLRYHSALLLLRFPVVAQYLGDGRLNMTTLVVMKDILTAENVRAECDKASNKTKTEVENQVAEKNPTIVDFALFSRGAAPTITELPMTAAPETPNASAPALEEKPPEAVASSGKSFLVKNAPSKASVRAITATQDVLTMTLQKEERADLEELCELLSGIFPDKDPRKAIVHAVRKLRTEILKKRGKLPLKKPAPTERDARDAETKATPLPSPASETAAATAVLTKEPKKYALTKVTIPKDAAIEGRNRDRKFTREAIPAATARFVWIRDNYCCQQKLKGGGICGSTYRCEIDHVIAVADNGTNDASNLRVSCRKHNQDRARQRFGGAHIDAAIRRRREEAVARKAGAKEVQSTLIRRRR